MAKVLTPSEIATSNPAGEPTIRTPGKRREGRVNELVARNSPGGEALEAADDALLSSSRDLAAEPAGHPACTRHLRPHRDASSRGRGRP